MRECIELLHLPVDNEGKALLPRKWENTYDAYTTRETLGDAYGRGIIVERDTSAGARYGRYDGRRQGSFGDEEDGGIRGRKRNKGRRSLNVLDDEVEQTPAEVLYNVSDMSITGQDTRSSVATRIGQPIQLCDAVGQKRPHTKRGIHVGFMRLNKSSSYCDTFRRGGEKITGWTGLKRFDQSTFNLNALPEQ